MSIAILVLVFVVLSGLDLVAVLLGLGKMGASSSLPTMPTAVVIHLIVTAVGCVAVTNFPGMRERPGYRTIGVFSGCLCLLTPVVGALASAWFVRSIFSRPIRSVQDSDFVIGNPSKRKTLGRAVPAATPVSEPLAHALGFGHLSGQRQAAPLLRSHVTRQSVALLRRLFAQPDARTQLYAQSALSSVLDNSDVKLRRLRRQSAKFPDDPWSKEALAASLIDSTKLGIYPDSEVKDLGEEATVNLDMAIAMQPNEPRLLFRKASFLIESRALDLVPEIYGRLCAMPNGLPLAERLEARYFAAIGNWPRTVVSVTKAMNNVASLDEMPEPSRHFWTCSASFKKGGQSS